MKKSIVILVTFVGCLFVCSAAQVQRIVLRDNSVVMGQVVEMKDGMYVVKTETMGNIKIPASKILEITALSSTGSSNSISQRNYSLSPSDSSKNIGIRDRAKKHGSNNRPKVRYDTGHSNSSNIVSQQKQADSRVRSMTSNEDFLESMLGLSDNSNMTNVMSDPEVMDAISRGDYDFLMNNEKMKQLMESPEIKSMMGGFE